MNYTIKGIFGLAAIFLSFVITEAVGAQSVARTALCVAIRTAYEKTISTAPHIPLRKQEIFGEGSYKPSTLWECALAASIKSGIGGGALAAIPGGLIGGFIGAYSVDQTIGGFVFMFGGVAGAAAAFVPGFAFGMWKTYGTWRTHFDNTLKRNLEEQVASLLVSERPVIAQESKDMLKLIRSEEKSDRDAISKELFASGSTSLTRLVGLASTKRELEIVQNYLQEIVNAKKSA